jgi:glycosyltransferase involved in cell wall biosynthesis
MYPDTKNPSFGVFVKNFERSINESGSFIISSRALIVGKQNTLVKKILNYFFFTIKIFLLGVFTNYDIIYVHYFKYSILPTFLLKKIFPKKKLIYNFHGSDLIKDNEDYINFSNFKLSILKSSDSIVVPSNYFKKLISESLGVQNSKIFVSPSGGINTKIFFPENSFQFKEELNLGYIGRLDKGKGVEDLISAMVELKRKKILFKVKIIGNGGMEEELKKRTVSLALKKNIVFLNSKNQLDLRKFYCSFDLFIFPTYSESLGLVGLEALSCGTPVLGSEIGEIQNYIIEDKNGFLFEPQNINMLVEKIIKYKELSTLEKLKLREQALRSAGNFNSIKVSKEMINFLHNL